MNARLCRWLLQAHDCMEGDAIPRFCCTCSSCLVGMTMLPMSRDTLRERKGQIDDSSGYGPRRCAICNGTRSS
jgi:hypothetical protein